MTRGVRPDTLNAIKSDPDGDALSFSANEPDPVQDPPGREVLVDPREFAGQLGGREAVARARHQQAPGRGGPFERRRVGYAARDRGLLADLLEDPLA